MPRSSRTPATEPRGAETILLVEDEPAIRKIAARLLRALGYQVFEALDGEEAVALAARTPQPIHLVVTDIVMPRMGGREVVERLRENRPDIRVLYVSGYAPDAVALHGVLEAEMTFLQKPFTRAELARAVRAALDS